MCSITDVLWIFFKKFAFGVKETGGGGEGVADNSPPPNDEVDNEWR